MSSDVQPTLTGASDTTAADHPACHPVGPGLHRSAAQTDTASDQHTVAGESLTSFKPDAKEAEATTSFANCTAAGHSLSSDHPDTAANHPSSSLKHLDCPEWLPEQLRQIQLSYAPADHPPGQVGTALQGQRVAFALLEDFEQQDSRREIDTLVAGLHSGQ